MTYGFPEAELISVPVHTALHARPRDPPSVRICTTACLARSRPRAPARHSASLLQEAEAPSRRHACFAVTAPPPWCIASAGGRRTTLRWPCVTRATCRRAPLAAMRAWPRWAWNSAPRAAPAAPGGARAARAAPTSSFGRYSSSTRLSPSITGPMNATPPPPPPPPAVPFPVPSRKPRRESAGVMREHPNPHSEKLAVAWGA